MPEVLWKGYIEFECGEMGAEGAGTESRAGSSSSSGGGAGRIGHRVRSLYRRLLQRADHVKVGLSMLILACR